MKIFISGGSKSTKSALAERLAKLLQNEGESLYYLATMIPSDREDIKRVANHVIQRQALNFKTIEIFRDINTLQLEDMKTAAFLLDSTTSLLANEMFSKAGINTNAGEKLTADIKMLLKEVSNIVIVSDYIYSNAQQFDDGTKCYCKALAMVDKCCAESSDIALEVVYGNVIVHKGQKIYDKLIKEILWF